MGEPDLCPAALSRTASRFALSAFAEGRGTGGGSSVATDVAPDAEVESFGTRSALTAWATSSQRSSSPRVSQ